MPERSKGVDLRSTMFAFVGSNPTAVKYLWGFSSNGRALALHARSNGIDAHNLQDLQDLQDINTCSYSSVGQSVWLLTTRSEVRPLLRAQNTHTHTQQQTQTQSPRGAIG